MTDLAKTITVPHQVNIVLRYKEFYCQKSLFVLQQLEESIKETLHTVNKHLTDETSSMIEIRAASPETNNNDHNQQKSNNIQLTIHTTYVN